MLPSTVPKSWENVFEDAINELNEVESMLTYHTTTYGYTEIYPAKDNIFNAFHLTPLQNVRVVIIGQDPYPQLCDCGEHPRAQGFSFSVAKCDQIPSSLGNIFKEIKTEYPDFVKPSNGDLSEWAKQGVLLLNTSLTVQPGVANSHGIIWHGFIQRVIKAIDAVNPKCIYVMWGREAQGIEKYLSGSSIKLKAFHPSGLSASRGFFGCGHFKEINRLLAPNEIKW
jgi:uracil-DNA glycosylase